MGNPARRITELPEALARHEELARRLSGRRPALFCDYDGTLTPIVDRPEEARLSPEMREVVHRLATRCPVCVVSGRDRRVVQELMGLDDLVVAGDHGFDIWSPSGGLLRRQAGTEFRALLDRVRRRLGEELAPVAGVLVEPKSASVAIHYRLVAEQERPRVRAAVEAVLAEHPEELRVTPGRLVYELQPRIDWDKGKAVLYLLNALGLDRDEVIPLYLGDDVTDEDAFRALAHRGLGLFVGRVDDPEIAGRTTCADYRLGGVDEVRRFLDWLAARIGADGIVGRADIGGR
jgi:trehalose 6-phosphate phosphatase